MLQEEDPSGESYIRINDGPILCVTSKPGYWDGPYSYLEKNGKEYTWVQTTKGDKVDVYTIDLFDFAERYDGDWEKIKEHIKVEYTYLDNGKREKEFYEYAKKECDEYNKMMKEIEKEYGKTKK